MQHEEKNQQAICHTNKNQHAANFTKQTLARNEVNEHNQFHKQKQISVRNKFQE